MYMTPILYEVSIVQERVSAQLYSLYCLNPMTPIVIAFHQILYYGQVPDLTTLLAAVVMGLVFLVLGSVIFHKLQRGFAEEL